MEITYSRTADDGTMTIEARVLKSNRGATKENLRAPRTLHVMPTRNDQIQPHIWPRSPPKIGSETIRHSLAQLSLISEVETAAKNCISSPRGLC